MRAFAENRKAAIPKDSGPMDTPNINARNGAIDMKNLTKQSDAGATVPADQSSGTSPTKLHPLTLLAAPVALVGGWLFAATVPVR